MQTYAVYWSEEDGTRFAGQVSVGGTAAELEGGAADGRRASLRLRFEEIAGVRYQHGRLHVWRRSGPPLRLGSVDRPGALRELADRLQARLRAA